MGRPGPAASAFELERAPGQAGVTVPPASPHRHGTPGRWPHTVGRSCPVTPPGAILGLTPSRAPRASARKGRRCRDPRNERARRCQAWAGQRGIRKGLLAWPQPATLGAARDLTWESRAVTSLHKAQPRAHLTDGDTEAHRPPQSSPERSQVRGSSWARVTRSRQMASKGLLAPRPRPRGRALPELWANVLCGKSFRRRGRKTPRPSARARSSASRGHCSRGRETSTLCWTPQGPAGCPSGPGRDPQGTLPRTSSCRME